MKINRNELEKMYNSILKERPSNVEKNNNQTVYKEKDSLVLSDKAKGYSGIGALVKKTANKAVKPTQCEKLLRLKAEISNGTYNVPSSSIAEAMLNHKKRSG